VLKTLQNKAKSLLSDPAPVIEPREPWTPGRWQPYGENVALLTGQARYLPLAFANHAINYQERLANARLMARAPNLLIALERLIDCPDLNLDNLEPETCESITFALSVIASCRET
jgi:hypothetical protein